MRQLKSVIFIISFFYTQIVSAKELALNNLIYLLNNTRTMQAQFTQHVYDNRGSLIQQTSGKMAMQRPGLFRWETISPAPQLIVARANKLYIFDRDLDQLTIRRLQSVAGDVTPALLLSRIDTRIGRNFTISETHPAGWTWFKLVARRKNNMFSTMMLGFSNNQIKAMRLQDNLGQKTLIRYRNIVVNTRLSPSMFVIKPSAKVDVIREG